LGEEKQKESPITPLFLRCLLLNFHSVTKPQRAFEKGEVLEEVLEEGVLEVLLLQRCYLLEKLLLLLRWDVMGEGLVVVLEYRLQQNEKEEGQEEGQGEGQEEDWNYLMNFQSDQSPLLLAWGGLRHVVVVEGIVGGMESVDVVRLVDILVVLSCMDMVAL